MRRYGLVDIPETAEDVDAVPLSRTLTINGTTYDLSADRTWTVATSLTLTTIGSSGAATLVGSTLNIPNYSNALTAYVPYTGATTTVNIGNNNLLARGLYAEGNASSSYQQGVLIKVIGGYNFGPSDYTQLVPGDNTNLSIVYNRSGSTRRIATLSADGLQDGDSFFYRFPRQGGGGSLVANTDLSGRFLPKATPGAPSAGDVYYDSTTNKLRCYNGTTWNDLF
jgi:hypothetical protein